MSALYDYAGAFFKNWFLYMTAGPFLLDELIGRLWPHAREKFNRRFAKRRRRQIEVGLLLLGVFYAGFAAFNDEYEALQRANARADTLSGQLSAMSPSAQTAEITRLQSVVQDLRTRIEGESTDEWPPLDSQQIETWATVLGRFPIKSITVHWNLSVNAKRFYRSIQEVGKKLNVPVIFGGGGAEGAGVLIYAPRGRNLVLTLQDLFAKAFPFAPIKVEEWNPNATESVEIFLGQKPPLQR